MALSFIIRRASSPVLPLANRAVGSPRTFHKAIANILNSSELNKDSKDNIRVVKQLVDDNLLRVIDTEIKSNEHEQYKIPKKFPFDVKDNYSENGTIELKREYFNELIRVEVNLAAVNESDEDESDSDSSSSKSVDDKDKGSDSESNTGSDTDAKSDESSNDSDDSDRVCIPMIVNVSKGSNLSLKLFVNAFPDEMISIGILAVRESKGGVDAGEVVYGPPEFWLLDDTVKDALHRYLEVRGIDVSTANVLLKYWEHKQKHDQTEWLTKLKKFIKK